MQHPQNHPRRGRKYFIEDLELHGDYSLLQKVSRLPKVIYSFEAAASWMNCSGSHTRTSPTDTTSITTFSPSILGLLKSRGIPTVLTLHDLKIACPLQHARPGWVCERCKGGKVYNVVRNRCINAPRP